MTIPNLPVPDELAEIRAKLKELDSRERVLRALLLVDPSTRNGKDYCVEIRDVETTRTDLKEMRKMHPEIVEQYTFPVTREHVELRAITEDGEIVRISRKAKEATNAK